MWIIYFLIGTNAEFVLKVMESKQNSFRYHSQLVNNIITPHTAPETPATRGVYIHAHQIVGMKRKYSKMSKPYFASCMVHNSLSSSLTGAVYPQHPTNLAQVVATTTNSLDIRVCVVKSSMQYNYS